MEMIAMTAIDTIILVATDFMAWYSVYLIASVALNLQYGYTGIPNFGLSLSVAAGAFVVGYLPGRLAMLFFMPGQHLDFITDNSQLLSIINARLQSDPLAIIVIFAASLALAILVAAILGYVATFPAIRLREDYLVMTLIAMAEAIRIIGDFYDPIAGGTLGVQVPDPFIFFGNFRGIGSAAFCFAFALVLFLLMDKLVSSPFGRLLRAVRDEETTAESVSKNTKSIKMEVMIIGSIIASIAGVLFAFYSSAVVADGFGRVDWTSWPFLMVLVGGKSNNKGAAVGTFCVVAARRSIALGKHSIQFLIPFNVVWFEPMLLGVTLILIMMFRPQGMVPEKSMKTKAFEIHER
jgi:branched-chain amino acid transport system permease protein